MKKIISSYWKTITYFIVISFLLLTPQENLPKLDFLQFDYADLIEHFAVFTAAGFIVMFDFLKKVKLSFKLSFSVILLTSFYGALTELGQHLYIPGRTGSIWDILADISGVIAGVFIFKNVYLKRFSKYFL